MPVTQNDREVILSLDDQTSVTILKYGATIVSWKADGKEQLWLSENSPMDGTAAVRGGIPLVFPVFATSEPPHVTSTLPPHGYARLHSWDVLENNEKPTTVQFRLGAEQLNEETRAKWNYKCTLVLSVTLTNDTLVTSIAVENTDSKPFEFNFAFHTYLRIPDISQIQITGLQGLQVFDKIKKTNDTETSSALSINEETARVYQDSTSSVTVTSHGKPKFTIEDKSGLLDVVVWNPWKEAAQGIPDFSPKEGFQNMVCVETGRVAKFSTLQPREKWEGSQTIKVHF
jgi:glucose-6-phosphate 1-epimerase